MFRLFHVIVNADGQVAVAPQEEDKDNFMQNMAEILSTEYKNISEVTDFEPDLVLATHRLVDIKLLQCKYMKNPLYPKITGTKDIKISDDGQKWIDQDPESIKSEIEKHVTQLIKLEQGQISAKKYYEKLLKDFNSYFAEVEGLRPKAQMKYPDRE